MDRNKAFAAILMLLVASCASAPMDAAQPPNQAAQMEPTDHLVRRIVSVSPVRQFPPMLGRPEERDGFNLYTLELAPDGNVLSCSRSLEGDDAVECGPDRELPSWVAPLGPSYRTLHLQIGSRMLPPPLAQARPEWGKLIASRMSLITVPEGGPTMSGCRVIASEGAPLAGVDTCSLNQPRPGPPGGRVYEEIDGWRLYGVPR